MQKYYLVTWPESQIFVGHPDCYLADSLSYNEEISSSAYFVPCELYEKTYGRNIKGIDE